jgi:hypothetical protein
MSPKDLSSCGTVGFVTGILGVLSVVPMLAWPPQSPEGVLHYPFTPEGFQVIQTWFFVHHIGLVVLLVGLAASGAVGPGRLARAAAWLAVLGMIGLTAMELFAIRFTEWETTTANEGALGAGYGITTSLVGIGMVGAGLAVLRARRWPGWWRPIPLLIGVTHFVVVTPAIFSNGYVIARLAIASWMALFAALGWGLRIEGHRLGTQEGAR